MSRHDCASLTSDSGLRSLRLLDDPIPDQLQRLRAIVSIVAYSVSDPVVLVWKRWFRPGSFLRLEPGRCCRPCGPFSIPARFSFGRHQDVFFSPLSRQDGRTIFHQGRARVKACEVTEPRAAELFIPLDHDRRIEGLTLVCGRQNPRESPPTSPSPSFEDLASFSTLTISMNPLPRRCVSDRVLRHRRPEAQGKSANSVTCRPAARYGHEDNKGATSCDRAATIDAVTLPSLWPIRPDLAGRSPAALEQCDTGQHIARAVLARRVDRAAGRPADATIIDAQTVIPAAHRSSARTKNRLSLNCVESCPVPRAADQDRRGNGPLPCGIVSVPARVTPPAGSSYVTSSFW